MDIYYVVNILKNNLFADLRLLDPHYNFGKEHIYLLMNNPVQTRQDTLPIFQKHSRSYLQTENAHHLEIWMC
jgi:hypothetical protein